MFDTLSERLTSTFKSLRGQSKLTESNLQDSLREVRRALLEADVALPVVKTLIDEVKEQALGQAVLTALSPHEAFVKIVHDELVKLMGSEHTELSLTGKPPTVILMAGLQGSGKTTTVAKLARLLKQQGRSVLVTSADVYRPAAIAQLERLANETEIDYFPSDPSQKPIDIANAALEHAKIKHHDVVFIDTAGRLHIDDAMMDEIKALHQAVEPRETLFVVDSMTGQDAANTAKAFHDALPLTGVVLTKTDGDARGGAALSVRYLTGKPIKYLGTGEKIDAIEAFHPERIASRILGMGDILSLVEQVEQKADERDRQKAAKMARKLQKGVSFDFQDFLDQIEQMKKLGGITSLMQKMPGMGALPKQLKNQVSDDMFKPFEAMINSMTPQERRFPQLIKEGSRKRRITQGSGTTVQDLNKLMKQFTKMQQMMRKMGKGGMTGMMKKLKNILPSEDMPF